MRIEARVPPIKPLIVLCGPRIGLWLKVWLKSRGWSNLERSGRWAKNTGVMLAMPAGKNSQKEMSTRLNIFE